MFWHDPASTFDVPMPQFPSVCPRCRTHTGKPFQVASSGKKDLTEVYVRCDRCHAEWTETRPPDRERPAGRL